MSLVIGFLNLLKRIMASNDPAVNWVKVLVLMGSALPVIVFIANATNSRDWRWYKTDFEDRPGRIIIYHDGGQIELQPGQPGFNELAEAIRASLAQGVDQQSNTGLSDYSRQEAYTRYTTVEAFFAKPVKLHAWFYTGNPTQMLFPITGRHSDRPIVFLGQDGEYRVNAPFLKTKEPIMQVLRESGYLN